MQGMHKDRPAQNSPRRQLPLQPEARNPAPGRGRQLKENPDRVFKSPELHP